MDLKSLDADLHEGLYHKHYYQSIASFIVKYGRQDYYDLRDKLRGLLPLVDIQAQRPVSVDDQKPMFLVLLEYLKMLALLSRRNSGYHYGPITKYHTNSRVPLVSNGPYGLCN